MPRKSTLVGMGTARPSGEFQPTLPAPRNPLRHDTIQRPAPPSAVALARRTDPPAGAEAPTTGVRVPPDETTLQSPVGSALPPASEDPATAVRDALRRRAEAAERRADEREAELAELKRRERVQAEAASPASNFPPPVTPPAVPAPVVVNQGVSLTVLEEYRKAQTKLMLAVAALLVAVAAPCALWLTNAAMQAKKDTERAQVQVTEAVKTSEVAKVQTTDASKEIADLKALRQADQLYFIAVMRKLGVKIRRPDGWPEPPTLEVTAPVRKPGQVDDGTSLSVTTSPAP